jgi:integrase
VPQLGIGEGLRLLLRLSLVTGQRIGAVALAHEPDLDLDGQDDPDLADSGPRWLIRGEAGTKADSDRVLPLSPLAVALFGQALALPGRQPGGHVFRGKKADAALSQQSISRAWAVLRKAGKVPAGTTPHDLRRTARTWWPALAHMQEEHILERILGHAVGSKVQRTYDRALWLPQQRAVLDVWGRKLETITGGGAKVVEMIQGGLAHA